MSEQPEESMIAVIDTHRCRFRGNYATEARALQSVRSLRENFYLVDDPMLLVDYETFSMQELRKLLDQFEPDASESIRNNRGALAGRLWHHWQEWGLGPYRKNRRP